MTTDTAMAIRRDANITVLNAGIEEETLYVGSGASRSPFLMDLSEDGYADLIGEITDASADKGAYAMRETISNAIDGDGRRRLGTSVPS